MAHQTQHQKNTSQQTNKTPDRQQSRQPENTSAPEMLEIPAEPGRLTPSSIMRLQRTVGNQAVQRMLITPTKPAIRRSTTPDIQRGEAGVHQGIEMEAWGTEAPEADGKGPDDERQQSAMEIYVGNWMRDYSQVFVPTVMNNVSEIPQQVGSFGGETIGGEGGEALVTGLLQALAALEFGPEITSKLISGGPGGTLGAYRPEEHMDNPAGMSLEGDLVTRNGDDDWFVSCT